MLVEIIIETAFRAVGAIPEYAFRKAMAKNVLHLRSKNVFLSLFYQHVIPTGYIIKMWVSGSQSGGVNFHPSQKFYIFRIE